MDMGSLVNKTVDCRFRGRTTRIALSHGLFSSFDVDSGTRLFLKVLAENAGLEEARAAVDVGCGTGVIGIALAAAYPGLSVAAVDRDALALAFTRMNAETNGLSGRVRARAGLLSDFEPGERFDRILSNLPAKAGKEALSDFLRRAPSFLSPGGSVWIVIVNTLATFAASEIALAGHEVLRRETGKEHTVFGFGPGTGQPPSDAAKAPPRLEPYLRGTFPFSLHGTEYELECARDIPDFDTPGYSIELCAKFLKSRHCEGLFPDGSGSAIVWNPGQGHVPAYCGLAMGVSSIELAGRDLLELLVSRANLERLLPGARVGLRHLAGPECLAEGDASGNQKDIRAIIAFPDIVPGHSWAPGFFEAARSVLPAGGSAIAVAPSAALSCLDRKKPEGFSPAGDRREKAFRAARFVKR